MSPRNRSDGARDAGVATVWAAVGVTVIVGLLVLVLQFGGAVVSRHRAEAAADLGALAAASHAVHGRDTACARAARVIDRMRGRMTACVLSGWEAFVQVEVDLPVAVGGVRVAAGRARAGPVAPDEVVVTTPASDER